MIKVYNLDGGNLSTIRYHDGFMGQRIGPISCLGFHPHRVSEFSFFAVAIFFAEANFKFMRTLIWLVTHSGVERLCDRKKERLRRRI